MQLVNSLVSHTGRAAAVLERRVLEAKAGVVAIEPRQWESLLLLLHATKQRPHLCGRERSCVLSVDAVTEGTFHLGVYRAGVTLVYTNPEQAPLVMTNFSLPTMCGGGCIYISDSADPSEDDIRMALPINAIRHHLRNCSFLGATEMESMADEDGDYEYMTGAEGVVGQLIIQFSPNVSVFRREDFLRLLCEDLEKHDGYAGEGYSPATTTVKWLSANVVGMFTEYNGIAGGYDEESNYTCQLDDTVVNTGEHECTIKAMGMSGRLSVLTYVRTGTLGEDSTKQQLIHDLLRDTILPRIVDGCSVDGCLITDNDYDDYASGVVTTRDVIAYLDTFGVPVIETRVWTRQSNIYYGRGFDMCSDVPVLTWISFPLSSNPNEGAHDLVGGVINVGQDRLSRTTPITPMEGHVVTY